MRKVIHMLSTPLDSSRWLYRLKRISYPRFGDFVIIKTTKKYQKISLVLIIVISLWIAGITQGLPTLEAANTVARDRRDVWTTWG